MGDNERGPSLIQNALPIIQRMREDQQDAMRYAIMAANFRGQIDDCPTNTLYCIGGSLDGKVRTERTGFELVRPSRFKLWVPGYDDSPTRPLPTESEFYGLHKYADPSGYELSFWVAAGVSPTWAASRASELWTDAAVLQDEQLICD